MCANKVTSLPSLPVPSETQALAGAADNPSGLFCGRFLGLVSFINPISKEAMGGTRQGKAVWVSPRLIRLLFLFFNCVFNCVVEVVTSTQQHYFVLSLKRLPC